MIVYFSGTGNSRYCAEFLADKLDDETLDAFHFIRDGIAAEVSSEKPWVFVAPTYGWQLPRIFANFLHSGSFSGNRNAYFVLTCGSDIGNAAPGIEALCNEKNWNYRGTLEVVMPENYIALFKAPNEATAQKIVEDAHPTLLRGVHCIQGDREFPVSGVNFADKLKSGIVNDVFYRFIIKAKAFTVSNDCVACGKCEQVCPLGNITMQGKKPVWGKNCTHCMACICTCPTVAIEYGKASRGKVRYQCPEYEKGSK